jgi:hydrogenase maturation factor
LESLFIQVLNPTDDIIKVHSGYVIASIDKKYREESAKIVIPLKNDNDNLESSSPVLPPNN